MLGEVHRDRDHRNALLLPVAERLKNVRVDAEVEIRDVAGLLEDRDEIGRGTICSVVVDPTRESLGADDLAAFEGELRKQEHLDLVVADGGLDLTGDGLLVGALRAELVGADAVQAVLLRLRLLSREVRVVHRQRDIMLAAAQEIHAVGQLDVDSRVHLRLVLHQSGTGNIR